MPRHPKGKTEGKCLPYTLCDNVSSMNRAANVLRSSSYIVCDCEGVNLGSLGGNLSIIALAALPSPVDVNNEPHVYLIDAIALKDYQLKPIYDLLRSNSCGKIMCGFRHGETALERLVSCEISVELHWGGVQRYTNAGPMFKVDLVVIEPRCT